MRWVRKILIIAALLNAALSWNVEAQSTLLQAGPVAAGRAPMYVNSGTSQPVVQDSGPAAGGATGIGLKELGLTVRGTGTPPYANAGSGPNGTNFCDYDAPTTNSSGGHYLCLSPNALGGGLLSYGPFGSASPLPFTFNLNGTTYQFPFSTGGVVGPTTSAIGNAACWNNTTGTLLADCGAFVTLAGSNAWTGANTWAGASTFNGLLTAAGTANFTGALEVGGVPQTFPASGNLVGTTDAQTLSNKTLTAPVINGGSQASPSIGSPTLTGTVLMSGTPNISGSAQFSGGNGLEVGSPTGGFEGAGSLNAEKLYANGNLVQNYYVQPVNASGSGAATTGTISATSTSLALTSALDFANGQGIRINHAGTSYAGAQPSGLAISQVGTAGSTTYSYTVAAMDAAGGVSRSITAVNTTTGNATLNSSHYNHLAWSAAASSIGYAVYGRSGGSLTLLGMTANLTFDDQGNNATPADWVPTAAPSANSAADWLLTTISSGAGTTALTLANAASNGATTQYVAHDDTGSLQTALTKAATTGAVLQLPCGTFDISSTLAASGRARVEGCGYQSDQGSVYNTSNISQTTGFLSTTIIPVPIAGGFSFATNAAVQLRDFQILYPVGGSFGAIPLINTYGISITTGAGTTPANDNSVIRDVAVIGHANCALLTNVYDFVVDNLNCLQGWYNGVIIKSPSFPSFGDSTIVNSTFWGNGVTSYNSHINVASGGGLRIVNNKFNFGSGTATSAILVVPNLAVAQTVEPLIIADNSIEGSAVGVEFNNANVANAAISLAIISGNEMWNGLQTINVTTQGTTQWLQGLVISDNTLQINGAAASGLENLVLDNVGIANIHGNTFTCSGGCATSTGIVLGSHTTNVNVQSNTYYSGFSTHVSNSGSGNTIGGGTD